MEAARASSTLASPATAAALSAEILACARALRTAQPNAIATAFWDFDGTLIEGDCCEGFQREDGHGYAGLADLAIQRGFSARFQGDRARERMKEAARLVLQNEGHVIGNGFIAQVFAGAPLADVLALARDHFDCIMRPWMFAEAMEIWRALEAGGIRCHVVSASPDFFVKGAAATLGVPEDRLHGARLVQNADGTLSGETIAPITYAEGKAEKMREVLRDLAAADPAHTYWPVAAFGNCLRTDGPLLDAVAHTILPAGKPLAVLINAPTPASSRGIYREALFSARVLGQVGG